ncbi:MAG: N-acetylmuramoyl-L-alanine amidase [Peptoniphilus sp.]|nr:N-acetylmuramoyl-L-alanine amidase [Peptoniphilus sp.]MDD7363075.1 N-acetylmuramoyl-L-alanine amidase [Bacillota bacterium]MDY6044403.1 N-acetylmuramoyl-L-alanine amidase [Peptoniphilus sp.]
MKRWIPLALALLAATAILLKVYASRTERALDEAMAQGIKQEDRSAPEDAPEETAPPNREPQKDSPPPKAVANDEASSEKRARPEPVENTGPLICIDAGHQAQANPEPEIIAPSSTETKAKVASGTRGVQTGIDEYVFTLRFTMLLKSKFEAAGYRVGLVRDRHDVDISNRERAEIANAMGADIYLRIHGNGSSDSSVRGIETYYPSPQNPDIGRLSAPSKLLSTLILEDMAHATGSRARGAFARDDLTGTNFATMPSSLIECGYMSNPEEDALLNDENYLNRLADGIVQGVGEYFQRQ